MDAAGANGTPGAPATPSTKLQRFGTGLADLPNKGAQLLTHMLPQPVVDAGNQFNNYLADKTGLVARVPAGGVDQMVNDRETAYQASRAAAGSTGFDWMRLSGNVANPANYVLPGAGAATTLGRIGVGALQGAGMSVATTPTTGADQENFWGSQGKLATVGALLGSGLTGLSEAASPYVGAAYSSLKSLMTPSSSAGATSSAASKFADAAFTAKGIDPATVDPSIRAQFAKQVQESMAAGVAPDAKTAGNLAEAASLPVPVPLLKGQASRDPMQYAKEMNLRGVQGVGEPIQGVMGQQNTALINNLDAMGAKGAPNVVDAGQTAINTLRNVDKQAQQGVSAAYNAFKASTGKAMDVPLQGVAQDYARIADEYGMSTIPEGVRNQLNGLGLNSGTQLKTFTIDNAENVLKIINKNYDPSNPAASSALDELRRSIQGAITTGAGSDAVGGQAALLAQAARRTAAARFNMIDTVPAYKYAISGSNPAGPAPDKFLQKFFWNGNAGDVANLKTLVGGADPQALQSVKSAIMGDIKQTTLSNQSPENGIFSQARYNGLVRDQNNSARLGAMFEPQEMAAMQRLGNVAENVLLPPKASAVNSSNTSSAAANLVQIAAQGGLGTKALSMAGKAQIPIVSPIAGAAANKSSGSSLADLVRQSTQPLAAPKFDPLGTLTGLSGAVGGSSANSTQK